MACTVGPLHIHLSYLIKICVCPLTSCLNPTFPIVMAYKRTAQSLSMRTCTLGPGPLSGPLSWSQQIGQCMQTYLVVYAVKGDNFPARPQTAYSQTQKPFDTAF